jgi:hypothetical protein
MDAPHRRTRPGRGALLALSALSLCAAPVALAKPIAPTAFCDTYPDAPVCLGGVPACTFCHAGAPPARNAYGATVEAGLLPSAPRPLSVSDFVGALPEALRAAATLDPDRDGFTSGDEIAAGTSPSSDLSAPDDRGCMDGAVNDDYDLCRWDPRHVLRKVSLDFCGVSPSFDDLRALRTDPRPQATIHRLLDRCLDSEFWLGQDGQLWELAHRKIKPLQAIKQGEDAGPIPLGDYYDDYALFVYTQTDDRDCREVLTADYFVVRRKNPTRYQVAGVNDVTGPQNVVRERRAGMLTTRWNLVLNVMFTALPRTAAAQAYRAYLGMDIAKLEGLYDVAGEPRDYDRKGVAADACKVCHATLDPLTYPFKNYHGITDDLGNYDADRIRRYFRDEGPEMVNMPEAGVIFGQRVDDLVGWARVAADSEAFAKATVRDYWHLLLGHDPLASEQAEFERLWRDLAGKHGYRVERMLHDLIDTEAYGVP